MGSESNFVTPIRVTRAYEELAAAIRARILSGELRDGDRIPPEKSLAQDAQVSRPTVREALRTLEEAGFLERVSPKILVVRHQNEDQAYRAVHRALEGRDVTFAHVHEALSLLEPEIVKLATKRATGSELEELQQNMEAQKANIDNPPEWNRISREFHLKIAELARNPALFVARTSLSELLTSALASVYNSPGVIGHVVDLQERIVEEMTLRDIEGAAHASRKAIVGFRNSWEESGRTVDVKVADLLDARKI